MSKIQHHCKVLVVEDEPSLSKVIAKKLKDAGYDVLVTKNGNEAVKIIKENKGTIHGIWLDFDILGINGLEFMKKNVEIVGWERTPVLIVSNTGNPVLIQKTIQLGAKKWIVKAENRLEYTIEEFTKLINDEEKNNQANLF